MEHQCKFRCTDGKLFDPTISQWVQCPECKGKRFEKIEKDDKEVDEAIGIESNGLTTTLVPEALVPSDERTYLEDGSFDDLKKDAMSLYNTVLLGKRPKYSMCFGLGVKGKLDAFIYPLLATGYSEGLSVAPLLSALGLSQKLLRQEDLDTHFTSDLCVILINEGCSKADIAACKGLMQERASRSRATIFITSWSIEACSNLLGHYNDESAYLAKPVFIRYANSGKKSNYINNLYGEKNELPTLSFEDFN